MDDYSMVYLLDENPPPCLADSRFASMNISSPILTLNLRLTFTKGKHPESI